MKNVVGNIQGHDVIPQINMEKENLERYSEFWDLLG